MTRSSPRSTTIYLMSAPLTCHPDIFTASCLPVIMLPRSYHTLTIFMLYLRR